MTEEDRNALAGEYMLGLLEGAEFAQAQALLTTDPDFALAVRHWERRLLPIVEEIAPATPPARVWANIAAATAPTAPAKTRGRRFWLFSGGGLAVLTAVVLLIALPVSHPGHDIATMQIADGGRFTVRQTRDALQITPVSVTLPADKVAELWVILPHQAPRPAGLFTSGQSVSISLPNAPAGLVLAVSVEPLGGSPTGAPTGPVIATASITKL